MNEYDSKSRGNVFGQGYNWKMEDEGGEYIILEWESGDDSVLEFYEMCAMWGGMITANNVDWRKVADELDEDLSGEGYATYNEYDNSIRIHIYEENYDYYEEEYEVEELDIWCEYTDDGILEYYRLDYDTDTLLQLELVNSFWIQYWIWVLIGIIALVAIIVLIVYFSVIYQKKPKVAPSAAAPAVATGLPPAEPVEKTPEPVIIEEKPEGLFCPYCGNLNTTKAKFCEYCGKKLEG